MKKLAFVFLGAFAASAIAAGTQTKSLQAADARIAASACMITGTIDANYAESSNATSSRVAMNCPIHNTSNFPPHKVKKAIFYLYDGSHDTGTSYVGTASSWIPNGQIVAGLCIVHQGGGKSCGALQYSDLAGRGATSLTANPPSGVVASDFMVGIVNLPAINASPSQLYGIYVTDT